MQFLKFFLFFLFALLLVSLVSAIPYSNNFTNVGQSDYTGDIYSVEYDGTYIYAGSWLDGLYVYTFNGSDFIEVANANQSASPDCNNVFDLKVNGSTIFVGGNSAVCAFNFNGTNLTLLDNYTTTGVCHGVSLIAWNSTYDLLISDHDTDGLRGYFWNGSVFNHPYAFKYERGPSERTYSSFAYNKTRIFSFDSSQGVLMYNISEGDDNFTLIERESTYYAYRGFYDAENEYLYTATATTDAYSPVGVATFDVANDGLTFVTSTDADGLFNKTTGWPYMDDKFVYAYDYTNGVHRAMGYDGATFTVFQNLSISGIRDTAGNYSDYLFVGDGGLTAWEFNVSLIPSDVIYYPVNPSFESGSPFSWTGTGGIGDRQVVQAHTGIAGARILQTGGVKTLLYQNLTTPYLNLTNGTNYTASGWIYIPSGQDVGDVYSEHGVLSMGSDDGSTANRKTYGEVSTVNTTDTWFQQNLTFMYNNATDLVFCLFANGSNASGGGYVYWDDAYIYDYIALNATVANDTCTCAGLDTNWEINLTDSCNLTSSCDLGTGDLSFTGAGTFRCNETLEITDMGSLVVDQHVIIQDNCNIIIG